MRKIITITNRIVRTIIIMVINSLRMVIVSNHMISITIVVKDHNLIKIMITIQIGDNSMREIEVIMRETHNNIEIIIASTILLLTINRIDYILL